KKAVFDQRRRLLAGMRLVAAWLCATELHDKSDVQVLNVGLVDLVERRIPLGIIGLVIGQPVARLALSIFEAFGRHLRSCQRSRDKRRKKSARSNTKQATRGAFHQL